MGTKKWPLICFRLSFYFRRFLLIAAILLTKHLCFQIILLLVQVFLQIAVIGFLEPYESSSKKYRELINEFVIVLAVYHVMCFTPVVADIDSRIYIGYSFIFLIVTHTVVSLGLIARQTIIESLQQLRRNRVIRKHLNRERTLNELLRKKRQALARAYVARRGHYSSQQSLEPWTKQQERTLQQLIAKRFQQKSQSAKEDGPQQEEDSLSAFQIKARLDKFHKRKTRSVIRIENRRRIELEIPIDEPATSSSDDNRDERFQESQATEVSELSIESRQVTKPHSRELDLTGNAFEDSTISLIRNLNESFNHQMSQLFRLQEDEVPFDVRENRKRRRINMRNRQQNVRTDITPSKEVVEELFVENPLYQLQFRPDGERVDQSRTTMEGRK